MAANALFIAESGKSGQINLAICLYEILHKLRVTEISDSDSRTDEFYHFILFQSLLHEASWPVPQRISPEPSTE